MTDHLEVLGRRALHGSIVDERIEDALAMKRHLLDTVDDLRQLDAEGLIDGRSDVDEVAETVTHARVGDALRPRDDERVANAAAVRL